MPNGESGLLQSMVNLLPTGLLAVIGGCLDYLYALHAGTRAWSLGGFLVHLAFACFMGYLVALLLLGLGYSPEVAGAAAGGAGFGNVKLVDLCLMWVRKRYGNGNDGDERGGA